MIQFKLSENQINTILDKINSIKSLDLYTKNKKCRKILFSYAPVYDIEPVLEKQPSLINCLINHVFVSDIKHAFSTAEKIKKYIPYILCIDTDVNKRIYINNCCNIKSLIQSDELQKFFLYVKDYVDPHYLLMHYDINKSFISIDNDFVEYITKNSKCSGINEFALKVYKSNIDTGKTSITQVFDLYISTDSIILAETFLHYLFTKYTSTESIDFISETIHDVLIDLCKKKNKYVITELSQLKNSSISFCKTFKEYLDWNIVWKNHEYSEEFVKEFKENLPYPELLSLLNKLDDFTFDDIKRCANLLNKSLIKDIDDDLFNFKLSISEYITNNSTKASDIIEVFDLFNDTKLINNIVDHIASNIACSTNKCAVENVTVAIISDKMLQYCKKRNINNINNLISRIILSKNNKALAHTINTDIIFDIITE